MWKEENNTLYKKFEFKNFSEAFGLSFDSSHSEALKQSMRVCASGYLYLQIYTERKNNTTFFLKFFKESAAVRKNT